MSFSCLLGKRSLAGVATALVLARAAFAAPLPVPSCPASDTPPALDQIPVPRPPDLARFVKNEAVAVQLGKALFWDQQVGSGGLTACASCHHAAGADPRAVNALHPGSNGIFEVGPRGSTLRADQFPILSDDVAGSQGVVDQLFVRIRLGSPLDQGLRRSNPIFGLHPQVTARNSPSVINAIFNRENFWDGRAKNVFNGRDPRGAGVGATVLQARPGGVVVPVAIELVDSSAASQAVEPANHAVEMTWSGRRFPDLGKKLLALRPLALQQVHPQDGVLGALRDPSGHGLRVGYVWLIREAFQDEWWRSTAILDRDGRQLGNGIPTRLDQFTLMEANFSLFWGLAIQMYEATLVSDDTAFDRFARGDLAALSANQQLGLALFLGGKTGCTNCHGGAEFSNATVHNAGKEEAFSAIGVDPASEDAGRNGRFKTSQLRNVELTGPYFHSGKYATLREVIDFYDRGGDVSNPSLEPLGLTEAEKAALVDFLLALTDERVRYQRAPFDHPSLNVLNGPAISAVGAGGTVAPLPAFLGLSPFDPGPH